MKVLIGYSTCPYTRAAFEAQGFEVWTCDIRADQHPRHLQCDIWEIANDLWDLGIFHPMCTYGTVSAAWAYKDPDYVKYPGVGYHQKVKPETLVGAARRDAQDKAVENFKRLDSLPYPHAIENPAPSMFSKRYRPPDQVIQPYQFGDDASKSTGLWLYRLPKLIPTRRIHGRMVEWPNGSGKMVERWSNQTDRGQNNMPPSEARWLERSRSYPGIMHAMGERWGHAHVAEQPRQLALTGPLCKVQRKDWKMPKFAVYAIATASKFLGEFEAETMEAAEDMALATQNEHMNICHQCAKEIEIGDVYEYQVEQIESVLPSGGKSTD